MTNCSVNENVPYKTNYALNDSELQKMLDYYRVRFQGIQRERIDWLKGLERINLSAENFHAKEWELHNLTDQITQIQQSLSESNIALNNERKRIIRFNNEIEKYKSNSIKYFI